MALLIGLGCPLRGSAQLPPASPTHRVRIQFIPPLPTDSSLAPCHIVTPYLRKALPAALQHCLHTLHQQGYLQASFDSLSFTQPDTLLRVHCHLGPRYTFSPPSPPGEDSLAQPQPLTAYHIKNYLREENKKEDSLSRLFVRYHVSLQPSATTGHVPLHITPTPCDSIPLHTLQVQGDKVFKLPILRRLVGLSSPHTITRAQLQHLPQRIAQIPHVHMPQPLHYTYTPQGLALTLYMQKRPLNQIAAQLALLPPTPPKKTPSLTGYATLHLVNLLQRAEELHFQWQSPQPREHHLALRVRYPYIAASSWGVYTELLLRTHPQHGQLLRAQLALSYAHSPELTLLLGSLVGTAQPQERLPTATPTPASHTYLLTLQALYEKTRYQFPTPLGWKGSLLLGAGASRYPNTPALPRLETALTLSHNIAVGQPAFTLHTQLQASLRTLLKEHAHLPLVEQIAPKAEYPLLGFPHYAFHTTALTALTFTPQYTFVQRLALGTPLQYTLQEHEQKPLQALAYGVGMTLLASPAWLKLTFAQALLFTPPHVVWNPWLIHMELKFHF